MTLYYTVAFYLLAAGWIGYVLRRLQSDIREIKEAWRNYRAGDPEEKLEFYSLIIIQCLILWPITVWLIYCWGRLLYHAAANIQTLINTF